MVLLLELERRVGFDTKCKGFQVEKENGNTG
jgi:hypothetical protein